MIRSTLVLVLASLLPIVLGLGGWLSGVGAGARSELPPQGSRVRPHPSRGGGAAGLPVVPGFPAGSAAPLRAGCTAHSWGVRDESFGATGHQAGAGGEPVDLRPGLAAGRS